MRRGAAVLLAQPERSRTCEAALIVCASTRRCERKYAQYLTTAGIDDFFGAARCSGPDVSTVEGAALHVSKAVVATAPRWDMPSLLTLAETGDRAQR